MKKIALFFILTVMSVFSFSSCSEDESGDFVYSYVIESGSFEVTTTFKLLYDEALKSAIKDHGGQIMEVGSVAALFNGEHKECDAKAIAAAKDFMDDVQKQLGENSIFAMNHLTLSIVLPTTNPGEDGEVLYKQELK